VPIVSGPLGQGLLSTGENLDNPLMRVAKVPVKVDGDDILIEVA